MIKLMAYSTLMAIVLANCNWDPLRKESNVQTSSTVDQQIIDQQAENDRETNLQ